MILLIFKNLINNKVIFIYINKYILFSFKFGFFVIK
jgi:hypothetical protein